MGEQFNYLNNLNRPNLVDITLLQKINDGYSYPSQPKTSYLFNMIQSAGSMTCNIAKDNIFISVVIISLILFLVWCYIEKQRQDVLTEKYLQKKLAKSLLSEELNLFNEVPQPLNVEKLFNDINTDLINTKININNQEDNKSIETMNQQNINQNQERPVHMTKREQNIQNYEQTQSTQINQNLNQYPSQGYPKGAARDFGQEFVQQQPTLVQQPNQQSVQQPNQQPMQQPNQQPNQQPAYQQALSQDGLSVQPISGPVGTSKYMDISSGFNKNSYMLM